MMFRFGPFEADRAAYRVSRDGTPLALTPKLLDLLFYLLERPAALVTKEALLDGVWPDANVTDNALAQAISELREALGDSAASPTYIRTIARRGYRFIAPVTATAAAGAHASAAAGNRSAPGAGEEPRAVAVLDFANLSGDADVAWLGAGIAETVAGDLSRLGAFRIVDRWRVRQAVAETGDSVASLAEQLGVSLVATGSFQRRGPQLRISARMIDVGSGDAVADAKVDGPVDDVFSLQDAIVASLAHAMGLGSGRGAREGHETSSLDAYRAYTEGWLRIEALDTELVVGAVADFQRAIEADPGFAQAFAGLANAEFVAYEMTRQSPEPNRGALGSGIAHAEHAIQLAPDLAEAHATLSFLLSSAGRVDEAQAAARRAVALEPDGWRHQYRLGHATWGMPRIRALERAIALHPQFVYARLEMAMVHVARGALATAESLARHGVVELDLQKPAANRFPGVGFHWLLGTLLAARGAHAEAITEFDRELARVNRRRLYGVEYGLVALYWRGYSEMARGQTEAALASLRAAGTYLPGHPRCVLGEADALGRIGDRRAATARLEEARAAAGHFRATDRLADACLMDALHAVLSGNPEGAVRSLDGLLDLPVSSSGWTVPLEPGLAPLHARPDFQRFLTRLADRAS
ncbi:MAG TPA: winged helix-turn-helix domain-containing protein [Vicinamibacterales bacterium]|nr:winged helix-turn-helix domain-containing protein [Vicinamibacterales bacterium]